MEEQSDCLFNVGVVQKPKMQTACKTKTTSGWKWLCYFVLGNGLAQDLDCACLLALFALRDFEFDFGTFIE
jgi:hypothetical protein